MSFWQKAAAGWCILALAGALAGCKSDALPTSTSPPTSSASPPAATSVPVSSAGREEVHAGVRFLVFYRGGADDKSPLVVGMHGRGGSPERFSRNFFEGFSGRAKLALAQAPSKLERGWSWFPARDEGEFITAFDAAEKQLWQAITELAQGRRVIVTGFSQGGILSYALAARHPREIAYAFPISGGAPGPLLLHDHTAPAPVYALHGASDDVIDVSLARSTVAAFKAEGGTAELREFVGVGHDVTPAMREDLWAHLGAAIDAESVRSAPTDSAARGDRAGTGPGVRERDAASESLR